MEHKGISAPTVDPVLPVARLFMLSCLSIPKLGTGQLQSHQLGWRSDGVFGEILLVVFQRDKLSRY